MRILPVILVASAALVISCASQPPSGGSSSGGETAKINLSADDASRIGRKIWQNESNGTIEGLTSWNKGENFASLGIGHFIWYPKGVQGPYDESFPKLISYMKQRQVGMPGWVANTPDCPWSTLAQFEAERNSPQMQELRTFLANTVSVQTDFIVNRLQSALPKMMAAAGNAGDKQRIQNNFYAVAQTPQGVYALIDYVNFKGEGTNPSERYKGEGWGLAQVLLEMRGNPQGAAAANEFSEAAKRVLTRRVQNAKPKDESMWLQGWHNRCETYKRPV